MQTSLIFRIVNSTNNALYWLILATENVPIYFAFLTRNIRFHVALQRLWWLHNSFMHGKHVFIFITGFLRHFLMRFFMLIS